MRIFVASRYTADTPEQTGEYVRYARKCCRALELLGAHTFAPHLYNTQFLDDDSPEERMIGINSGLSWLSLCDAAMFFIDHGIGMGMTAEWTRCHALGIPRQACLLGELARSYSELRSEYEEGESWE